jgi:hypothetical protein
MSVKSVNIQDGYNYFKVTSLTPQLFFVIIRDVRMKGLVYVCWCVYIVYVCWCVYIVYVCWGMYIVYVCWCVYIVYVCWCVYIVYVCRGICVLVCVYCLCTICRGFRNCSGDVAFLFSFLFPFIILI